MIAFTIFCMSTAYMAATLEELTGPSAMFMVMGLLVAGVSLGVDVAKDIYK